MIESKYTGLIQPGEVVDAIPQADHGSQEWAFGYGYSEIQHSTHTKGNSVVLDVEPGGAVEPVLITEDITLTVRAIQGSGKAVICNTGALDVVREVDLSVGSEPVQLVRNDAYYYLNTGENDLVLRDDSTPDFQGHEEIQLTAKPADCQRDGRAIKLPDSFWLGFVEK